MAFQRGLRELGYVEGQNIVVEYRFADGKFERLSDLASELVRLKVDVIVPRGRAAILAAKAATTTVPIVFGTNDPVGSGLVASLARPGGNLTGISIFVPELIPKRLQLLKEALKTVSRIGVLENPADPNTALFHSREFEETARILGVQLIVVAARGTDDVADAFSAMVQARAEAAMVLGGALFFDQRRRIVDMALNHRLPLATEAKEYTAAGGLMSYGVSIPEVNRQTTTYVDKISQGRQSCRSARRAADEVRAGGQFENRQGTGAHDSASDPGACRRGDRMSRRKFLASLVSASMAWPIAVCAQQPAKVYRIGILTLGVGPSTRIAAAFRQGLREHGYVEGQNIALEYRFAEGRTDRLPAMAAELVRMNIDIIVTESTAAAVVAKQATQTIPIVMAIAADAVGAGLVAGLARPGGNITGFSMVIEGVMGKRLQLLKEVAPKTSLVGVIWNPSNPSHERQLGEIEAAARSLGLQLQPVEARNPADLDAAFKAVISARASAVLTFGDGMMFKERTRIVEFARSNRLPGLFADREFAEAGGLMVYGPNLASHFRRAAVYVDKILKGAKPRDLPIEQPTKFELIINMKAARALGITVPESILIYADEVIE